MSNRNILFLIGGLVLGFLFNFLIYGEPEEIEVIVPSVQNELKIENPVPDVRVDTIYKTVFEKGKEIIKTEIIGVANPVNKNLMNKYREAIKENDSLKQLHIFKEAIRERKYTEVLEDSIQVITVKSDVIGTLKSQLIHYETKEQVLKIDVRKKTGSFFVGGFSKVPLMENEEVTFGVKLDLVKEKNIISAGFDNQKNIIIGYTLKLF